jgi:uncharacterized protein YdhG (YjbR/CyaY superfamily)
VNPGQRAVLHKLRRIIRGVVPSAEECISYSVSAFRLDGRSFVFFAAWRNYCSFYPGSSAILKKFQNDMKGFRISKGTIRFSPENPPPTPLVKKLVKARLTESRI